MCGTGQWAVGTGLGGEIKESIGEGSTEFGDLIYYL